ncbi:MAG: class I SAM-dependent methyltransferase [Bryobacteraceae bacterium]|nr:class I SAM-dependent methyltransferase [Bryobacteraceae bacterium]
MLSEIQGKSVLDAGCGDGTYAIRLANHGAMVTALDFSFPMLTAARQRASVSGVNYFSHTHVRWCQGDIRALPLADGSFDVALAITVLCMIDSPEQCGNWRVFCGRAECSSSANWGVGVSGPLAGGSVPGLVRARGSRPVSGLSLN